jgi:hypothetical protein
MAMRFTKIKFDGAKMRIEYEVERADGNEPDEYTVLSVDRPMASFDAALQALAADVVAVCELPADSLDKFTVRGVSISHTNDIMGACVTALKALKTANSPLVVNTPHLPSAPYSDNPDEPVMADEMRRRLSILMDETQRYLDGERAQASLFAAEPEAVAVAV